jgi:hypothetical protein
VSAAAAPESDAAHKIAARPAVRMNEIMIGNFPAEFE